MIPLVKIISLVSKENRVILDVYFATRCTILIVAIRIAASISQLIKISFDQFLSNCTLHVAARALRIYPNDTTEMQVAVICHPSMLKLNEFI